MDNILESFRELKISKNNKEDQADQMTQLPNTTQIDKKRNIDILALTIKDIVNNSLRNITLDGSWKESFILPLQKK